jgi:hypothetical protein
MTPRCTSVELVQALKNRIYDVKLDSCFQIKLNSQHFIDVIIFRMVNVRHKTHYNIYYIARRYRNRFKANKNNKKCGRFYNAAASLLKNYHITRLTNYLLLLSIPQDR